MCRRTRSGGMPRSAWLMSSTCAAAAARRSAGGDRRVLHEQLDEPRVVDLEDQPGVDDGQVLLAQRLGHRGHVLVLGGVVLVEPEAHRARGGQERLGDVVLGDGRLETRDVALDGLLPAVAHRSGADHEVGRRGPGARRRTSACTARSTRGTCRSRASTRAGSAAGPRASRTRRGARRGTAGSRACPALRRSRCRCRTRPGARPRPRPRRRRGSRRRRRRRGRSGRGRAWRRAARASARGCRRAW